MSHFTKQNKDITQTTTDMLVGMFANDEKLVASEEQIGFNKEDYIEQYNNNNDNPHLDDDLNDYKKPDTHIFKHTQQSVPPRTNKTEKVNDKDVERSDTASHKNETQTEKDDDDESKWTNEEKILRKLDMLRKLGELTQAGVELSTNYDLDSDYKMMKYEYELHTNIRSKRNALSWMGNMLVGIVKGIEMLNDHVNPFDLKFDGMWSDNVKGDITNYYDVLGEIYEKYTSPNKKMPPELKLFLLVTGSAVSIQMHKGMANMLGSKSTVANDLHSHPDKFSEIRNNIKKQEADQKAQFEKKIATEHTQANEKMAIFETLKKQKEESEKIKRTTDVPDYMKSLILSDSAKSRGSRKLDSAINQMQGIIQQQQQQQNQIQHMLHETKKLENIDSFVTQIEKQEKNIMGIKTNDDVSVASTSVSQKNPKFNEALNKPRNKKSKVLQTEIISRSSIENEIGEHNISLGNSKDSANKKKKRAPRKISLTKN